jgi:hypothetical protein
VSGIGASSFLDLSMIYVLAAGVVAGATSGVIGALLTRGMKR